MATLKIDRPGQFSLSSSWKCGPNDWKNSLKEFSKTGKMPSKYKIASGPSTSSTTISFNYSLPSGKKIKGATLWAKLSSPVGGISVLTANGNSFSKSDGGRKGSSVSISSTSGTASIVIKFRSGGKVFSDTETHYGTIWLSDVSLYIEYDDAPVVTSTPPEQRNTAIFAVPPQSVCIYDPTDQSVYMFDGVCKINHSLSMDIQEEPEKPQGYVNNAKNQPDKLTIDIVMSDVYTGGGAIVSKANKYSDAQQDALSKAGKMLTAREGGDGASRSESAYRTLHWLKEERRKLCVITPQYVYVDMIIGTVTVNQDDACPFGWEGQIGFQGAFQAKEVKKQATAKKAKDGTGIPAPAILTGANSISNVVGRIASSLTGGKGG